MKRQAMKVTGIALGVLTMLAAAACSTVPTTEQARVSLKTEAAQTLAQAKAKDPSLVDAIHSAAGYAVFPSVVEGAVGVGGAHGRGVLYQDGEIVGFVTMSQATIGFQLGGQAYSEIIVFKTPEALNRFKSGNFEFTAQAVAVALQSGAAANAKYAHGVVVFTMRHQGLMYQAAIGGQKFSYEPMVTE